MKKPIGGHIDISSRSRSKDLVIGYLRSKLKYHESLWCVFYKPLCLGQNFARLAQPLLVEICRGDIAAELVVKSSFKKGKSNTTYYLIIDTCWSVYILMFL